MKRLRSTETLGATSAICSDKTGTLTLNQMTAVELTIPGRRYTVSGTGYSTEGQIKHVAGEPEVDLEQFMLPLAPILHRVVDQVTRGHAGIDIEAGDADGVVVVKHQPAALLVGVIKGLLTPHPGPACRGRFGNSHP